MVYEYAQDKLTEISQRVEQGENPRETVRNVLEWFGFQRRGIHHVRIIRGNLRRKGLRSIPDIDVQWIDGYVEFAPLLEPDPKLESTYSPQSAGTSTAPSEDSSRSAVDPVHRIGRLEAANSVPVHVRPDDTLTRSITLMMDFDYSQLPVMTNDREVKGIISWDSIGTRLALGAECTFVRDCMTPHSEISTDASLVEGIARVAQHTAVLVRGGDNRITGIITATDFSIQLQQLSEPFLLIGQIENQIRELMNGRFTQSVLQAAKDPSDDEREIAVPADLTFGEHVRLLQNPENWEKLELNLDRKVFIERLNQVRNIRNEVMHFDPDGIGDEQLTQLRRFSKFLEKVRSIRDSASSED